jgi:UDP-glucose 4-epimerase
VREALKGVDTVFHLACKKGPAPGETPSWEAIEAVNVGGTRLLVQAAREQGVSRFLFFSSISVYGGATTCGVADETTRTAPDSWYALSKVLAESIVLGMKNAKGDAMGVVLRVASVYGPGEKKSYGLFITLARHGLCPISGEKGAARTLIHDADLAQAAILAATHPRAAGGIYNVTDGHVHSVADMVDAIGLGLGRPVRKLVIPKGAARAISRMISKLELSFSRLSGIRTLIDRMSMDTAVSGDKIQQELGFRPAVNPVEGWRDAVFRYS